MSFKRELISVLRELASELHGLKIAIVEQNADLQHRVEIVETEQSRIERRMGEVESKFARR